MKTADDLRKLVNKYLTAELSTLDNDLKKYNIQSVTAGVLVSLDEAMLYDKITMTEYREAMDMFGWVGEYE